MLTVHDLVARSELGLRWVAGIAAGADDGGRDRARRPVTWVHTSELADPTPFLAGGEVLLTTGLAWSDDSDAEGYVGRLVEVGVVGLGFGTGLTFADVPPALAAAAEQRWLPLFEVPRATPFIAISRAVSRAIAADEYAAVQRTFTDQQALTRAALSDAGPRRVVRLLSRQVGGAVVMLDATGNVLQAAPAVPAARVAVLRSEVRALARHAGSVGVAFPDGVDTVSLQAVGTGRGRTFLAVARDTPLTPDDRHLINAAVLLLTIRQERASGAGGGPEPVSAAVVAALVGAPADGPDDRSSTGLPGWATAVLAASGGTTPAPPWTVAVADAPPAGGWSDLIADVAGVVGEVRGRPVVLLGADSRPWPTAPSVSWGLSRPTERVTDLPTALREAQEALDIGRRTGGTVTRFGDVAGAGWSALVPADRAAAWAAALLAPIRDHRPASAAAPDGPELLRSLRAWLLHHGQWDPAAAELGVHRHTLRKRIRLVEQLLGRSLEAPGVRAEVWLALEQPGVG